jgi:hypothetical protein
MLLLRAFIAALVFAVACGQVRAADVVGYSEAYDTLYRVNLTTQSAQEIGRATPLSAARYSIIDGLTYSPDGRLFAVADARGTKSLLQISASTGLATIVGSINLGSSVEEDVGLAFTADGKLWLSTRGGDFFQINPTNGTATLVGNLGVTVTGMTSRGNALYAAGSQGNNNLYQIDPATAHATLIGEYGTSINYVTAASPAFDASGQLWIILDYVPPPSDANPTAAKWSDLSRNSVAGNGTLLNLGPITAPANSISAGDLEFIGLRGFAIVPPSGGTAVTTEPTPALGTPALACLILLFAVFAGTRLGRHRPN